MAASPSRSRDLAISLHDSCTAQVGACRGAPIGHHGDKRSPGTAQFSVGLFFLLKPSRLNRVDTRSNELATVSRLVAGLDQADW